GAATVPATAQLNLVQDPGFESANSNEYVDSPAFLSDGVWQVSAGSVFSYDSAPNAHSGSHFIFLTVFSPSTATLQQTLSATAGRKYDISFWHYDQEGPTTVQFGSY